MYMYVREDQQCFVIERYFNVRKFDYVCELIPFNIKNRSVT